MDSYVEPICRFIIKDAVHFRKHCKNSLVIMVFVKYRRKLNLLPFMNKIINNCLKTTDQYH